VGNDERLMLKRELRAVSGAPWISCRVIRHWTMKAIQKAKDSRIRHGKYDGVRIWRGSKLEKQLSSSGG